MDKENIYYIIDLFASEYNWEIEYIMSIPFDVIEKLIEQVNKRKFREYKAEAYVNGISTNLAFSGKLDKLDSIFKDGKEKVSDEEYISGARALWIKMKKPIAEFDRLVAEGKEIVF